MEVCVQPILELFGNPRVLPMLDIIAIRIDGRVYQFRTIIDQSETDTALWVSVQSLLPLPEKHIPVQPTGDITNEPRAVNDYTRTPILCNLSMYSGQPIARITHYPTKRVIPLYYSAEWLQQLQSTAPAVYQHNNRYWLFSEYNRELVDYYKTELNGKWCNRTRCWVFTTLPTTLPTNQPIQPVSEMPVFRA